MMKKNICRDILFGIAIGDALGVPVEFKSRKIIAQNPVTDMMGYGTYNLPAGTFSDDSSMAFCLAEALTHPFSLVRIANNFVAWLNSSYWTPRGTVFDVGITTSEAIRRFERGCPPELSGGMEVSENGNGSLMRILPLLVHTAHKPQAERYTITQQVSAITHGHIRAVIACFYYLEFARQLMMGTDKFMVYRNLQSEVPGFLHSIEINPAEIQLFQRLLNNDIAALPESEIHSSGYVLHTLEASIWCLLTTNDYAAAALQAVNLGSDTDTTGAVTGGLAGLVYGAHSIPAGWMAQLARKDDINNLASRLQQYNSQ